MCLQGGESKSRKKSWEQTSPIKKDFVICLLRKFYLTTRPGFNKGNKKREGTLRVGGQKKASKQKGTAWV